MKKILFVLCLALLSAVAKAAPMESVYTDLGGPKCKTALDRTEGESRTVTCLGVAGYRLRSLEDDLRQTVNVIDPQGVESPLDLWSIIFGGFSSLGAKAEWRVEKQGAKVTPRAMIVRFNASENPSDPNKVTSYLVVVKLTPKKICATDRIPPDPKQNDKARAAADVADGKACLTAGVHK